MNPENINLKLVVPEENIETKFNLDLSKGELNGGIVYVINGTNLRGCPKVNLFMGNKEVTAILDSGAEISVLSETIYSELVSSGMQILNIPVVQSTNEEDKDTGTTIISDWRSSIRTGVYDSAKANDRRYIGR
jgi:hypothetical protein